MIGLVEVDLWLPEEPAIEPWRWLVRLAAAAVFASSLWRWSRREQAPPAGDLRRAWIEATVATTAVAAGAVAWIVAVREPYDAPDLDFLASTPAFLGWGARRLALAALQQGFLQLFFWRALREILGRGPAPVLAAAAVFAAFHLPSPALAAATFAGAVVWISLYRRNRRLVPLVLSHAALAGLVSAAAPERLFYDMQAGARALPSVDAYRLLARDDARSLLRVLTSPEYRSHHGRDDRAWVAGLYRDVLGRPATERELAAGAERIARESPAALAKAILTSAELTATAGSLRNRSPDYRPLKPGITVLPEAGDATFQGWYDAEGHWRWARSSQPAIRFRLERETGRPYVLELTCGVLAPQAVRLELNGAAVGRAAYAAFEPRTRRFVVAPERLAATGDDELRLAIAGERVDDGTRALGLGFRSLRLTPLRFPGAAVTYLDEAYFTEGFSVAEESLRWSEEPVARLVYPLERVEPVERYVMRLVAGALGRQRVDVLVNGRPVARWTFRGLSPQTRVAHFPAPALRAGVNEVELRLPDARSAPGDPRRLGVALVSVAVHPLPG